MSLRADHARLVVVLGLCGRSFAAPRWQGSLGGRRQADLRRADLLSLAFALRSLPEAEQAAIERAVAYNARGSQP